MLVNSPVSLAEHVAQYLQHALGAVARVRPWRASARLPTFLTARYRFFEGRLFDHPVLFLVDDSSAEETPATIRKHLSQAAAKCDRLVIYVRAWVTAYNRQRLIQQRVPFIVPDNQMYLPALGIDLRERFRPAVPPRMQLRPSAQAALIHALLRSPRGALTAADLATELGYSAMTLGRVFDEWEAANLVTPNRRGRTRYVDFTGSRGEVWQRAEALLSSPVKGRRFVALERGQIPALKAGLSALAHYSSLGEPSPAVVAMSAREWAAYGRQSAVSVLPFAEPEALEVEVWSYPPRPFVDPGVVDPLSLYLSQRDSRDERVEMALQQMLEGVRW